MKIHNTLLTTIFIFTMIKLTKQQAQVTKEDGVIKKFRNGLQMAGKLLGLDAASNVAQLITEAFKKNNENEKLKEDDDPKTTGLITILLKMLSFDTTKISAVVINAIIFLAQMISVSLTSKKPALPEPAERLKKITDGSPIEWILENKSNRLKSLMETAEDNNLTDKVLEEVKNRSKDTACVQQLICRISPFVSGMQKALVDAKNSDNKNQEPDTKRTSALFRYLPEMAEFKKRGEECKHQHQECRLLD
ncbi:uncharacterized protein LOC143915956 [Arctopsyche grandis]|uniref:uncharacterized protein LOC143915956 n=1 Tax=Arctopsyche grandis TaxID=121162 RepID=UPI00406D95F7